jgi:FMN reductase
VFRLDAVFVTSRNTVDVMPEQTSTAARPLAIVAVSGSLHAPSKSTALLTAITTAIAALTPAETHLIEVSELAAELGPALRRDQLGARALDAVDRIEAADLLVVASPVYRASYTGLFKHLFDHVAQSALAGTPVLVAASGGSERHALVLEHQFRPLFGFFEAFVLPVGVYAKDADYTDYVVTDPSLQATIEHAAQSAVQIVRRS